MDEKAENPDSTSEAVDLNKLRNFPERFIDLQGTKERVATAEDIKTFGQVLDNLSNPEVRGAYSVLWLMSRILKPKEPYESYDDNKSKDRILCRDLIEPNIDKLAKLMQSEIDNQDIHQRDALALAIIYSSEMIYPNEKLTEVWEKSPKKTYNLLTKSYKDRYGKEINDDYEASILLNC